MMNETMAEKDYKTYMFIISYIKENGFSPSYREIADGTGVNSISTVLFRLRNLEELGKIEVRTDTPRAIKVVGYQYVKGK